VGAKLVEAVGVDVLDPEVPVVSGRLAYYGDIAVCPLRDPADKGEAQQPPEMPKRGNVHTTRASRDPPTLRQTLELALARVLRLALHKVVIVVLAPCADEVGR